MGRPRITLKRPAPRAAATRRAAPADGEVLRVRLANGLEVVAEPMPHVRSLTIGVWVKRGSRHETDRWSGASHFIEHMLFKGTTHRTAQDIARQMDAVGGGLDAFTGKEYACFHAKALDTELPLLVDILADLVTNPLFAQDDVKKERQVIVEEIKMALDAPDDLVHEQLMERLWAGHPLGRPILGTEKTVGSFDGKDLRRFWSRVYSPRNLLVAVAGRFERDALMDLLQRHLGPLRLPHHDVRETPPRDHPVMVTTDRPNLEQVHVCLGVTGMSQLHHDRHAAHVLNTILGGSMSSRLFQSIREERGLAYTVYSFLNAFRDAGYLTIYAGCSPKNLREVTRLTAEALRDLAANAVPDEELARAKGHLKGNLMLGLESSSGRMSNLARSELYFGRQATLDQMVAQIDGVTAGDVRRVARGLFTGRTLHCSIVGRLKGVRLRPTDLELPS